MSWPVAAWMMRTARLWMSRRTGVRPMPMWCRRPWSRRVSLPSRSVRCSHGRQPGPRFRTSPSLMRFEACSAQCPVGHGVGLLDLGAFHGDANPGTEGSVPYSDRMKNMHLLLAAVGVVAGCLTIAFLVERWYLALLPCALISSASFVGEGVTLYRSRRIPPPGREGPMNDQTARFTVWKSVFWQSAASWVPIIVGGALLGVGLVDRSALILVGAVLLVVGLIAGTIVIVNGQRRFRSLE
jgi:hypothetical protein